MRQQTQPTVTSNSLFSGIREGLTRPGQKELPSKFLYDEVGSALFEAISVLPEYGLTRADVRLLQGNALKIVSRLPLPVIVAELGTGSGKKTRWLLEALARRRPSCYCPVEISRSAFSGSLAGFPSASVTTVLTNIIDWIRLNTITGAIREYT